MKLSVVVLCYRSEEKLLPFLEKLKEILNSEKVDYELVLVANYLPGQKDKTPSIVKKLANNDKSVIPVIYEKKGMMGWDAISGLNVASGDAIALIDGDGQMPPKDIIRLFNIFKSGEFDFIKTFRIKRYDGFFRRIQSKSFNWFFRILFPRSFFRDINSKPKIISKKILKQMDLSCPGWFLDGEIMLEVRRLNLSFAEIPTEFHEIDWRGSFVKPTSILEMILSLIYYRFKYFFFK